MCRCLIPAWQNSSTRRRLLACGGRAPVGLVVGPVIGLGADGIAASTTPGRRRGLRPRPPSPVRRQLRRARY
jgi:hypothetical protein